MWKTVICLHSNIFVCLLYVYSVLVIYLILPFSAWVFVILCFIIIFFFLRFNPSVIFIYYGEHNALYTYWYNIICDKVCQCLAAGRWFSLGTPVSATNKTDRHDIAEILLRVALNIINLNFSTHTGITCNISCIKNGRWWTVARQKFTFKKIFFMAKYMY